MRILVVAVITVAAAAAHAQGDRRRSAADPQAKVPPLEFRSAFEGYRPFAEEELRNWRRSNEQVREAGGHAGHRPGQGTGQQTSKPEPGKPESGGGVAEKSQGAPPHKGHGGHK